MRKAYDFSQTRSLKLEVMSMCSNKNKSELIGIALDLLYELFEITKKTNQALSMETISMSDIFKIISEDDDLKPIIDMALKTMMPDIPSRVSE